MPVSACETDGMPPADDQPTRPTGARSPTIPVPAPIPLKLGGLVIESRAIQAACHRVNEQLNALGLIQAAEVADA